MHYVPPMRVVKVVDPGPGEPGVVLVDVDGAEVVEVGEFLRTLVVRRYSPSKNEAWESGTSVQLGRWSSSGRCGVRRLPAVRSGWTWPRRRTRGRLLSPRTCNRILGAVSSFYEYLIT